MSTTKRVLSVGLLLFLWTTIQQLPQLSAVSETETSESWTFEQLEMNCSLIINEKGTYNKTVEGQFQSTLRAGLAMLQIHCQYNTTVKGFSPPNPKTGYILTSKIDQAVLGTEKFTPAPSKSFSEGILQISNILEDIALISKVILEITVTFPVVDIGEEAIFQILPISSLTIVETVSKPEMASENINPSTNDITVGPLVIGSLETWNTQESTFGMIGKTVLLCGVLGITLNFLQRRKRLTESKWDTHTQLLLDELEEEDLFAADEFGML